VLVLLHHCLTEYLSTWKPWKARKGDTAHWLLVQLFVNGNQAYFMTLFFFLSGGRGNWLHYGHVCSAMVCGVYCDCSMCVINVTVSCA
jgi:hypothetical protein